MPASRIVVGWPGPDFAVEDAAAAAAEGEYIEAALSLGTYDDPAAVAAPALGELARFKLERRQGRFAVEPIGDGDTPLVDFDIGDQPNVLTEAGSLTPTKLVGYELRVDEQGHIAWSLSFGEQLYGDDDRFVTSNAALNAPR